LFEAVFLPVYRSLNDRVPANLLLERLCFKRQLLA
jgi:hypothetical protein